MGANVTGLAAAPRTKESAGSQWISPGTGSGTINYGLKSFVADSRNMA
jgi:hypothetical protein